MYEDFMFLLACIAVSVLGLALLAFFSDGYAARLTAWAAESVLVWGVVVTARVYMHHKRMGTKPGRVGMTYLTLVGRAADAATWVHERCIASMLRAGWTHSTPTHKHAHTR